MGKVDGKSEARIFAMSLQRGIIGAGI